MMRQIDSRAQGLKQATVCVLYIVLQDTGGLCAACTFVFPDEPPDRCEDSVPKTHDFL
jgi:hypothetical protein